MVSQAARNQSGWSDAFSPKPRDRQMKIKPIGKWCTCVRLSEKIQESAILQSHREGLTHHFFCRHKGKLSITCGSKPNTPLSTEKIVKHEWWGTENTRGIRSINTEASPRTGRVNPVIGLQTVERKDAGLLVNRSQNFIHQYWRLPGWNWTDRCNGNRPR